MTIIFWPLDAAIGDEKFGSNYEAWLACDEFAVEYFENRGVYI